jgi:hypothetical protein
MLTSPLGGLIVVAVGIRAMVKAGSSDLRRESPQLFSCG